jgi:uncharacterized protein HemY
MADPPDEDRVHPRRRGVPDWTGDFGLQTLANAFGTLMAALVLFLGGVLLGAIRDVPTATVVWSAILLASLIGMAVSGAILYRHYPRYRAAKRAYDAVLRPWERVVQAHELERRAFDADELRTLLAAARAADQRGDDEEAESLVTLVERRIAEVDFATDLTERYLVEVADILAANGIENEAVERVRARRKAGGQSQSPDA